MQSTGHNAVDFGISGENEPQRCDEGITYFRQRTQLPFSKCSMVLNVLSDGWDEESLSVFFDSIGSDYLLDTLRCQELH